MGVSKLKTLNAAEMMIMSDEELVAMSRKEGIKMAWCPIAKEDCKVECAWFLNGECCIASICELTEKLDDVVASVEDMAQVIKNKDFTE